MASISTDTVVDPDVADHSVRLANANADARCVTVVVVEAPVTEVLHFAVVVLCWVWRWKWHNRKLQHRAKEALRIVYKLKLRPDIGVVVLPQRQSRQ